MNKWIIYLSGPMTGIYDDNKAAFNNAEKLIKQKNKNRYKIINPHKIKLKKKNRKPLWEDYLKKDIKHLVDADIVVLLDNWKSSKGATLEVEVAHKLNIGVMPLTEFLKSNIF